MAGFSELIKNFDKIRDYMQGFYIYGFKLRNDFNRKSARSYDNEKRRIEGYLGEYISYNNMKNGKTTVISLDPSKININPLYAAWKSKTFTTNDIMLHFYIIDILKQNISLSVSDLTELISNKSNVVFDSQIVRLKCVEYAKNGILQTNKQGKVICYSLSDIYLDHLTKSSPYLLDGIKFFTEAAAFGEIGSFMLDNEEEKNEIFSFKHHYIVHTLEDSILKSILSAIKEKNEISFINYSEKTEKTITFVGLPLKIFNSLSTGRRYVCIHRADTNRFSCFRLDYIKSVKMGKMVENADILHKSLNRNIKYVWGVSFGSKNHMETLKMKIFIDEEKETYIIERIKREGRGGKLEKIEDNIYLYIKECFDTTEMAPWIKTFIGRIIELECTNKNVVKRFEQDIRCMYEMYCEVK
jgi:hypothetical protein